MITMVTLETVAPKIVNCVLGWTRMIGCCALLPPYPLSSLGRTKCTNSCSTNDMPIAVIRKVRERALRLRSGRYAMNSSPTAADPDTSIANSIAMPRYNTVSAMPLL